MTKSLWFMLCLLAFVNELHAKLVIDEVEHCSNVVAYKGVAYFCANHALYGKEVFVTTGDEYATNILIDIDTGAGSSSPRGFFIYKGFLFFMAETNATGWSLFRSDGSKEGTKLIRPNLVSHADLRYRSGYHYSHEVIVAEFDDHIYFEFGENLIRTDGTYANTVRVDVPVFPAYFVIGVERTRTQYAVYNDQLFVQSHEYLYRVNTDASSTLMATFPSGTTHVLSSATLFPTYRFNNQLIIAATNDVPEREIWISDGTANGTKKLFSDSELLGEINGNLILRKRPYYWAGYDDTDTVIVTPDLQQVSLGSVFESWCRDGIRDGAKECEKFSGKLLLHDRENDQLWSTNGNKSGTQLLPITTNQPYNGVVDGNYLYVVGNDYINNQSKIYRTNGTVSGTSIATTLDVYPISLTIASSDIYFVGLNSQVLWKLNKRTLTSKPLKNYLYRFGAAFFLGTEGNRAYFSLSPSTADHSRRIIGHSNGTTASTYTLKYSYDDGLPEIEPKRQTFLTAILYLLLGEDENKENAVDAN